MAGTGKRSATKSSEPSPIRASVARTGTKCRMRSTALDVPFGGAPHLERRSDTTRVSKTRPDPGLPRPTGKLSNSSRALTIYDLALGGTRLGEVDDRSSGDRAVLDQMPEGNQQPAGDSDDSDTTHP